MRMRNVEPFNSRGACWEAAATFRHGGPCPAAVCPLARPALGEAVLGSPDSEGRRRAHRSGCPTAVVRRRQPEVAVARTESGECPLTLSFVASRSPP